MRDSDIAYEKLKMMIVTAQLKPGEALSETSLMEQLELGRTPIREGLNRLAWEDFIKIIPRQCILVNDISIQEVESVYQMRLALVPLESELAVKNRTEEDIEKLTEVFEQIREERDPYKRVVLDRSFHRVISSMTRNPFLEKAMNNYQDLSIRLLFLNKLNASSVDDLNFEEHASILKYIREESPAELITVQRSHVLSFRRKFIN